MREREREREEAEEEVEKTASADILCPVVCVSDVITKARLCDKNIKHVTSQHAAYVRNSLSGLNVPLYKYFVFIAIIIINEQTNRDVFIMASSVFEAQKVIVLHK